MQDSTFYGAFSVAQSQRSNSRQQEYYINDSYILLFIDVPSPIYNVPNFNDKPSSPQYKIGKSKRSSIVDKRKNPGPGQYDNNIGNSNFSKGVKILGKYIEEPSYDDVSPSKYNPRTKVVYKTQPSFSFAIKQGQNYSKETPAPNHYFRDDQQHNMQPRSSSKQKDPTSMNDINSSVITTKNHRKSIDGSGTYNKGFTTAEKLKLIDKKIPGIGQYNIENPEIRAKTPGCVFEKSKRSQSYIDTLSPGPGAFHSPLGTSQANRFSMGTSERQSVFAVNQINPGPGAYEPKLSARNNATGYLFGPSQNNMQEERQYDEKSREERKRKERVDEILKQRKIPNPGPQDYQEVFVLDKKVLKLRMEAPQIYEYNEIKRSYLQINENPGPGEYEQNYQTTRRQLPSYHIQERPKSQRRDNEDNPGPGEYNLHEIFSNTQGPFFKIGRSQRSNPVRNKYKVGPGSYLLNRSERGSCYSMGHGQRFSKNKNEQPGPGQYSISGDIGKMPSYMLKRRNNKSSLNASTCQSQTVKIESLLQSMEINELSAIPSPIKHVDSEKQD